MRRWIAAYGEQLVEPAWRADLWGRRILFWTAYAPYILSSPDPVYRSAVLHALGARRTPSRSRAPIARAPGLARIQAWAGVIAAALVVQGGPARLSSGEAGLARALGLALHDDGGLLSRSPGEQLALVETLAQLRAVYIAGRRELPGLADRSARRRGRRPPFGDAWATALCRAGKAAIWSAAAGSRRRSTARA